MRAMIESTDQLYSATPTTMADHKGLVILVRM